MNNIQFNYLYRDGANFKVFGFEVFSNPDELDLVKIEAEIKKSLIDSLFFDPNDLGVKRLRHEDWIPELDHTWNEFECLELTMEKPTINMTISEFLLLISRIRRY